MTNSPEFPTAIICARNPYCNYRDLSYEQKLILPACQECISRWRWQQKNSTADTSSSTETPPKASSTQPTYN